MSAGTSAETGPIGSAQERRRRVRAGLGRRHLGEQVFKWSGLVAIVLALGFVAILFANQLIKGIPAFSQSFLSIEITFDPAVIKLDPRPARSEARSDADFAAADLAWRRKAALVNWKRIIEASLRKELPEGFEIDSRGLRSIVENNAQYGVRDRFVDDPGLLGKSVRMEVLASADVDNWLKARIDRSLGNARQQLSEPARNLADLLKEEGVISDHIAWHLFTNVDSRAAPAAAGLAGAFVGSLYMMVVVIVLAVPIGVASAIYLEEFAPRSRLTDLIEVNINNLAAVPSIVFGLLGAAVFINYFRLPLSAPLVGGLCLTLMTLPTIIIATRGALRGVPPSLRQAALGMGASRTQMVFHHVLPVTFPSILTATIIGVAQALGETAPLLLIGMNAFVASVPTTPLDQSTALPVQIFLWQGNENRNFFEPRTAAAILVLLGLMIVLNALAVFLRTRLERRA